MEVIISSVTQRIQEIEQPRGGYLPIKLFAKETFDDGLTLNDTENIHPSLIGLTVDYMTRFLSGDSIDKAFRISLRGASIINMSDKAEVLKSKITGLDDSSIFSACQLVGFDVCFRSSIAAYKPIEEIVPDKETIENIRIMINRSLTFLDTYGPITHSAPTFDGGYTKIVNKGDADFTTKDTLWDFKVLRATPTSKQTLQILMYYIMGMHSKYKYFKEITKLGFYNPRHNTAYICQISDITKDVIEEVEEKVICYGNPDVTSAQVNVPSEVIEAANVEVCQNHSKEVEYGVADVFRATRRKKHLIYNDIHRGKLIATKKGNKYVISESDFNRYVEYIKTQNTILISILIVILIALFVVVYKDLKSIL